MSTLLATATAFEDNVLDTMKVAEDVLVHTARTLHEGFEPLNRRLPELPSVGMVPTPVDVVDHTFAFVDRLVTNVADFAKRLIELVPIKVEAEPARAMRTPAKAQAA